MSRWTDRKRSALRPVNHRDHATSDQREKSSTFSWLKESPLLSECALLRAGIDRVHRASLTGRTSVTAGTVGIAIAFLATLWVRGSEVDVTFLLATGEEGTLLRDRHSRPSAEELWRTTSR